MLRLPDERWKEFQLAVWRWTGSPGYLRAVARDGSVRHDADGRSVEPVGDVDRLAASVPLLTREVKRARTDIDMRAVADKAARAAADAKALMVQEQGQAKVNPATGRLILSLKKAG